MASFGMNDMCARWTLVLAFLGLGATGCSSTTGTSSGPAILHMYTSSSAAGPWTIQTVPVNGVSVVSLVDPAPILMPDGRLLIYYTMNNQPLGQGDPASAQPNNQWKIGVAQSTDNGVSFTHVGVVFTGSSSTVDPFPLIVDASGTIRLFMGGGAPNIFSVTATDNTGFHFASTLDAGFRVMGHGDPEAIKIGSTYFLYSGGTYFTSTDGLNFGPPGGRQVLGGTGGGFYAISQPNGTLVAAFTCGNLLVCTASSPDGITWTQTSQVGFGSVPGLVRTADGIYRIYTPGP